MRESHLDAIMEVEHESFTIPWSRKMLSDELANKSAYYLAAVADGKAVGYAGMWLVCDEGHITNIAVHPAYRRQGIAAALTSRLALEILKRGKAPFYCCAWSNIASARNAIDSGFKPAWTELTVKPGAVVDKMNDI